MKITKQDAGDSEKHNIDFKYIQGAFFNCSHPKVSKCQPVSKLRPKKLEYQNCSHPKKKQRKKKVKVSELFPP